MEQEAKKLRAIRKREPFKHLMGKSGGYLVEANFFVKKLSVNFKLIEEISNLIFNN